MRSLECSEIEMISAGSQSSTIQQASEYYKDIDTSYKLSFALGGITTSLACMMGLPATISLGLFSVYTAYLSIF